MAPEYISPSSLMKWQKDKAEFFLQYLCESRPPRPPQTKQMAVGSAFDAYVKEYLMGAMRGEIIPMEALADRASQLYKSQVSEEHQPYAVDWGMTCFRAYRDTGALARLLVLFEGAERVSFEGDLTGVRSGIPLRGKPDIFFFRGEVPVILDWKVNGFFSTQSPKPGYIWCNGAIHKNATLGSAHGVPMDVATDISDLYIDWATQLAIYAWLAGSPHGTPILCGIDQLTNRGGIRVSQYRNWCGAVFQDHLLAQLTECWGDCSMGAACYCAKYDLNLLDLEAKSRAFNDETLNKLLRPNRAW